MAGAKDKPGRNCPRCPRLVAFRKEWRNKEPSWFNAPVPSFGPVNAKLLIIGLAPGLQGANRTGRPFTGDYAGVLLYETLLHYKFARGQYGAHPDDGLTLTDCRITNAVRCVPPANKPTPTEIATCRVFLKETIAEMKNLRVLLALGRIAHESALDALNEKKSKTPFTHGGRHTLGKLTLFCSYHCSRLNTNTGVLTPEMFARVFRNIREHLAH